MCLLLPGAQAEDDDDQELEETAAAGDPTDNPERHSLEHCSSESASPLVRVELIHSSKESAVDVQPSFHDCGFRSDKRDLAEGVEDRTIGP
ncbi:hypothetical protein ACWEG1_17955 [Streptomyces bauhiniae]